MSVARQAAKAAFAGADLFLPSPPGPRLLIYHQVGAGIGRQMEVTNEAFLWQLDWLVENRRVVQLSEALHKWKEPESEHLVVLTFDDGYRDTYDVAFPELARRGLPFVLYLATAALENGSSELGAEPLLWNQVESMMESELVTIGSHTHTHLDLRDVSESQIDDELGMSDQIIMDRLGVLPQHFAYPWGYWSQVADDTVRARYDSAVLGAPHTGIGPFDFDVHKVHRFPVQLSDRPIWFRRRLRGGLLLEENFRRRLRGYDGP